MIEVGSVVNGKYRLTRLLGEGGMGTVYEAEHGGLGTRVAIKVLHPDLARRSGLVERFLQEARVAAQIRSLHVVQVTDVDRTSEGQAYIVMELLNGEPLSVVLGRQPRLPPPIACEYADQVLQALEAAHALGIIHRDLKPENVFVTVTGERPLLKLIDFGIAKARPTDPHQRSLTVAGVVMGTAEYMAPEQARSADKVDARSDLYAVGVLLYEMLAGARPVTGDDARVVALKVERGEVVPLVQAAPDVPREIAGLVHRAMAARPDLRFSTATEMRVALESLATGRRTRASPPMARDGRAAIRALPTTTTIAPQAPAAGAALPGDAWSEIPRRQRRARTFATVALSLLFGASAVAIFIAGGIWNSGAPPRPELAASPTPAQAARATPPPELVAAPASASRPPPPAGIPALLPPRRAPVAPAPRPSASAPAASSGTDAANAILPPVAIPMAVPSSLPPFPSALPVPEGFPTTLPTVLPAWPMPSAARSASSAGQTL